MMKNKVIFGSILAFSMFFVSCKKELEPQESVATDSTATATTAVMPTTPEMVQPQPTTTPTQQPVLQSQATKTAPGMNPPHGEPNHRCDIAVGAPLNSPPGKNPTAQPTPTPAPVQVQPQNQGNATVMPANAANTVTAPGMNPPHGQPGHKCEIAVGAPLPK